MPPRGRCYLQLVQDVSGTWLFCGNFVASLCHDPYNNRGSAPRAPGREPWQGEAAVYRVQSWDGLHGQWVTYASFYREDHAQASLDMWRKGSGRRQHLRIIWEA